MYTKRGQYLAFKFMWVMIPFYNINASLCWNGILVRDIVAVYAYVKSGSSQPSYQAGLKRKKLQKNLGQSQKAIPIVIYNILQHYEN